MVDVVVVVAVDKLLQCTEMVGENFGTFGLFPLGWSVGRIVVARSSSIKFSLSNYFAQVKK